MNINILRWRRLVVSIALWALTCGTPSRALCGSSFDISFVTLDDGGGVEAYSSKQLKKSGMPTPTIHLTFGEPTANATGIAFDSSGDLWTAVNGTDVIETTAAQLKDLKKHPNPTPAVTITSTGTFKSLIGCNFDTLGNLWLADNATNSIYQLSKETLAAGSGDVSIPIVITSSALNQPNFVTFDESGNLWTDSYGNNTVVQFSASQLTDGGNLTPAVVLSNNVTTPSINGPGQLAFDKNGHLWFPNLDFGSVTTPIGWVTEISKSQLTTGSPAPTVKLISDSFDGPWGAAFDPKGDLFVVNFNNSTMDKFEATHLKIGGTQVPKVTLTGIGTDSSQIVYYRGKALVSP